VGDRSRRPPPLAGEADSAAARFARQRLRGGYTPL